MATVDFFSAFEYEWAETGSIFDWDDAQYKLGWATVGSTPPTVEQFNRVHQVADEKSNWLYGQLKTVADAKSVTLSSADLTGLEQVLDAYTPLATTTTAGIMPLATGAEAISGTVADKAITPSTMAQAKSYKILFGSLTPGAINFVVPANVYSITFELVGGGGGGGAGSSTAAGVGGGAGGFGIKTLAVTPGQSLSGVLGARGNAGGGANGPGGNGGASTFGGVTANGGAGGGGGTTGGGGTGGTVVGADWAFIGGNGNGPSVQNNGGTISYGAPGGLTARQGFPVMGPSIGVGIPSIQPGNGGGSGAGGSATIQAGGQGGPGSIVIWG